MSWFLLKNRRHQGPFTLEELEKAHKEGRIGARDFLILEDDVAANNLQYLHLDEILKIEKNDVEIADLPSFSEPESLKVDATRTVTRNITRTKTIARGSTQLGAPPPLRTPTGGTGLIPIGRREADAAVRDEALHMVEDANSVEFVVPPKGPNSQSEGPYIPLNQAGPIGSVGSSQDESAFMHWAPKIFAGVALVALLAFAWEKFQPQVALKRGARTQSAAMQDDNANREVSSQRRNRALTSRPRTLAVPAERRLEETRPQAPQGYIPSPPPEPDNNSVIDEQAPPPNSNPPSIEEETDEAGAANPGVRIRGGGVPGEEEEFDSEARPGRPGSAAAGGAIDETEVIE